MAKKSRLASSFLAFWTYCIGLGPGTQSSTDCLIYGKFRMYETIISSGRALIWWPHLCQPILIEAWAYRGARTARYKKSYATCMTHC
jgi:hypothetical protein